jgi:hypothetical protein
VILGSRQVSWFETLLYKERVLGWVDERPIAGTPSWCALADDDARKMTALVDAGVLWCLNTDTEQEHLAEAAKSVCQSVKELDTPTTWSAIAKEAHDLEAFYANRPWMKRVVA